MFNLSYEEIDLMREMINFKIIDKRSILKKKGINEKELREAVFSMNSLLKASKQGQLIETDEYILYYGSYDRRKLKMKEIFKFKNTIREEIIYLFLLLSENRFNIMKFGEKFWGSNENRKTVKSDLRKILKDIGIGYEEYMASENPSELIKSRINKFEQVRVSYLKKVLMKKWERVYSGKGIKQENTEIKIICEELKIKDIDYIYSVILDFFNKYGKLNSRNRIYDFFTYFILNLYNQNVNVRKRVTAAGVKLKENEDFKLLAAMFRKIEKREGIKIYSYFKVKLYKLLLKQEKSNSEVFYRNYDSDSYMTAEETLIYENEKMVNEGSSNKTVSTNKEIRVLLAYDLENGEISKNMERIKKIFSMMKVVEITGFEKLRKSISEDGYVTSQSGYEENEEYEYILILSSSGIENIIENYTDKPVFLLNITEFDENGEKKGRYRRNAEFYNDLDRIREMMEAYGNYHMNIVT